MDNKLFNVNGEGSDMLLKALELAFMQHSPHTPNPACCVGWQETVKDGLILCWTSNSDNINSLPGRLTAEQCLPFVKVWLQSDFAKNVKFGEWCGDMDHDGHNTLGWQVYCGDWGHVGNQHYAICAIRPAFLWHGK